MNPRTFLSKAGRRLRYEILDAPRGRGKPVPREAWEKMYREGAWRGLDDLKELGHYAVIAGYARAFSETAIIWDIGCGHGRLLQLLQPHFSAYTGLDISEEAIAQAAELNVPRASFVAEPFEDWSPAGKADLIIFNESLLYATRPDHVVRTYSARLNEGGQIIISQVEFGNHRAMWKCVSRELDLISGVRVQNDQRQTWNVRVFASRKGAVA